MCIKYQSYCLNTDIHAKRDFYVHLYQSSHNILYWVGKAAVLGQFSVVAVVSNEEPQMSPYIFITAVAISSILGV
ncbi:hypothetical protein LAZ67_8002224 [Cordylochernes scorpioides]|uniref:Uncharacterized protein n=1 Tax=Cordylochernes scorpioides TaxID=51811 RepID=A0ABY6KU02_9ARAC|nr:hypothetical protein LAZ67_8002224 [Cordylochernes scorpioides]